MRVRASDVLLISSRFFCSPVICDWLDVTYSPDSFPLDSMLVFLGSAGASCLSSEADSKGGLSSFLYSLGAGTVKYEKRPTWIRLSASGGALAALRSSGLFPEFLAILSDAPHTVTRLDAALDVAVDAPPVLRALHKLYPLACNLFRKSLPVSRIIAPREDGQQSGTLYIGHRTRAKATARVYDKALEVFERQGLLMPPTTRYEVTARREMGCTLRDASLPDRIFWHIASPVLLQAPDGVEPWESGWGGGWVSPPRPDRSAWDALRSKVQGSAELDGLVALADLCGPEGRRYLVRLVCQRVGLNLELQVAPGTTQDESN